MRGLVKRGFDGKCLETLPYVLSTVRSNNRIRCDGLTRKRLQLNVPLKKQNFDHKLVEESKSIDSLGL